jgi:hypothetical protein
VDESRHTQYFKTLQDELRGPDAPAAEYINGDTPLFEQVVKQDGVFNRILFYRRNSLHSGRIARDFVPVADIATGRLSINCFLDPIL